MIGRWRETQGKDLKSSWPAAACRSQSQESVTLSLGFSIFLQNFLTSVTNQEAWKWPMKGAMAPKDVPICSQLKLVQDETSRRDAGSRHYNKSSHSPGLRALRDAGDLRGCLLWSCSRSARMKSRYSWG